MVSLNNQKSSKIMHRWLVEIVIDLQRSALGSFRSSVSVILATSVFAKC